MGSRYGGLKQIDPVGPSGETMLDYAVFDAVRAGFGHIVFVIRRDFEEAFRANVIARYAGRIAIDCVFQATDDLPGGAMPVPREKPWGTGHAVWTAHDAIKGNFAVINADDFYGADSFRRLAAFLNEPAPPAGEQRGHRFCMVGFQLANTLSEHGAVSRGLCTVEANGALRAIVEQTGIQADDVGEGKKYAPDQIVSMNCWGFTHAIFAGLDGQLREFVAQRGTDPKAEFYLPAAVSAMVAADEASVQVLTTDSAWFGVTYREDKPRVQAALAKLVAAGTYPEKLF
jgi:UTP-glucose-1-phosphate uridylyltransferase